MYLNCAQSNSDWEDICVQRAQIWCASCAALSGIACLIVACGGTQKNDREFSPPMALSDSAGTPPRARQGHASGIVEQSASLPKCGPRPLQVDVYNRRLIAIDGLLPSSVVTVKQWDANGGYQAFRSRPWSNHEWKKRHSVDGDTSATWWIAEGLNFSGVWELRVQHRCEGQVQSEVVRINCDSICRKDRSAQVLAKTQLLK